MESLKETQEKSCSLRIQMADPAGNLTVFVLDPVPRRLYPSIGAQLLAMPGLDGEQVSFVTGPDSMEMCGLEFCGNASRAFALMQARAQGLSGRQMMRICVSGCDAPLTVQVDPDTGYTKIQMPSPRRILPAADLAAGGEPKLTSLLAHGFLVDMDGIMHLVLRGIPASEEIFCAIKGRILERYAPPALGVMFCEEAMDTVTPVVYVKDVDATYFEGSCGSGTVAVAAVLATKERDGSFSYPLAQPAGSITATIDMAGGALQAAYIEGPVTLGPVQTVTVCLAP